MNTITINNNKYTITTKQIYDVTEGWQVTEILANGEPHGFFDGFNGYTEHKHNINPDDNDELVEFITENCDHEGWDIVNELQNEQKIKDFCEEHAEEWVILVNQYESETGKGFANTYRLEWAEQGEESTHGWEVAQQLKDIDEDTWAAEILAFATKIEQGNH